MFTQDVPLGAECGRLSKVDRPYFCSNPSGPDPGVTRGSPDALRFECLTTSSVGLASSPGLKTKAESEDFLPYVRGQVFGR